MEGAQSHPNGQHQSHLEKMSHRIKGVNLTKLKQEAEANPDKCDQAILNFF